MITKQLRLDFISVSLFLVGLFIFQSVLDLYLSGLSNPLPFKFILMFSLGLALFYEIKDGVNRSTLLRCLTTMLIFSMAVYFAIEFREFYLWLIDELRQVKEVDEKIGIEYISALQNKAVGIGACYAASVTIFRITVFKLLNGFLSKFLTVNYKDQHCDKCGHELRGN